MPSTIGLPGQNDLIKGCVLIETDEQLRDEVNNDDVRPRIGFGNGTLAF